MRRLAALVLGAIGVLLGSAGGMTAAGAQAGGWQVAGASTEVAVYADGTTYRMNIHHINLAPNPGELAAAEPLYAVVFPLNPLGLRNLGALTVNGYQPQCDPCFHPGLPLPLIYHDHVLAGTPAAGSGSSAVDWQATRHPIAVMYSPAFISSPAFRPLTTVTEVQAGEQSGDFLPINPGAGNPYELPQDVVITIELVRVT